MTSGNSPVPTMAFTPRYRACLRSDAAGGGGEGRLQGPSSRAVSGTAVASPLQYRASSEHSASTSCHLGWLVQLALQAWGTVPSLHRPAVAVLFVVLLAQTEATWRQVPWNPQWPSRTCSGQKKKGRSWVPMRQEALMAERRLLHGFHTLE